MGTASAFGILGLGLFMVAGCAGQVASPDDEPLAEVQAADEGASPCPGKDPSGGAAGTAVQADVGSPTPADGSTTPPFDQGGLPSSTQGAPVAGAGSAPPPYIQGGSAPPPDQGGSAPPPDQGGMTAPPPVAQGSGAPPPTVAGAPPGAPTCNCVGQTGQATPVQGQPMTPGPNGVPVLGTGFAPVPGFPAAGIPIGGIPVGGFPIAGCAGPVGCDCCCFNQPWSPLLGRFNGLALCFRY